MSEFDPARAIIMAESSALAMLAASLDETFTKARNIIIATSGKVIVSGMGKSGLIGRKIAATFQSTGTKAAFLHPADAAHGDMGMIGHGDILLALSNSGETDEMRPVLKFCEDRAHSVITITSNPNSYFAKHAAACIVLPPSPEGCPIGKAPMASAMMMMAVGDALAGSLMIARNFTAEDFLEYHHGGYLGRSILEAVA